MFKAIGVIFSLCVMSASVFPQQIALGLSDEDILRMKVEEWVKYYTSKTSSDGIKAEEEAVRIYTLCLQRQNESRFTLLQDYDQERLRRYREILGEMRHNFLEAINCYRGEKGVSSREEALLALREELLFQKLIALNRKVIADPTQERYLEIVEMIGTIRKEMARHAIVSVEERAKLEQEHRDWRGMQQFAVKSLSTYDALLSLLPRERQEETLAVLSYCWEMLSMFNDLRGEARESLPAQ